MTGDLLNDRYRLAERIATGGMGEVWRARDEVLHRDVAVKMLKHEYADDATFLERFRAEARHAAGLSHPGIAGVFDYGEAGGTAYLVMELVKGEPLSAIITTEGRLSPERTLDVAAQAARGLEAAHQGGVVHRDVKPGNILVCPDGTVKLTDFGIARAADAVPLTQTGMVMGTAHYLSPEQANGKPVTYASDVYSLGVVAYECLAGRRPFEADTPVGIAMAHLYEDPLALPDDVPPTVSGLVAKAMAKDPEARFPSAAAFAQAADAVRAELDRGDVPAAAGAPSATMVLPAAGDATAATAATAAAPATAATTAVPVADGAAWGAGGAAAGVGAGAGAGLGGVAAAARRLPRGAVAGALALVGVLLLAMLAWGALKPAPEQRVPQLRGLTKAQAVAALERRNLDLAERTAYSDSVPRGEVIRQDPAPGKTVREGDDVSVTISRGPQPVRLPSGLSGRPVDDVVRDLERLGLTVRRQGEYADRPFGTVTSVSPTSGLTRGSTVTVRYSLGKQPDRGKGDDDKDEDKKGKGDD